jgi:putative ABC transport system permease protein
VEVQPLGVGDAGLSPDTLRGLAGQKGVGAVGSVLEASANLASATGAAQQFVIGADPGAATDVLGLTFSSGRLPATGKHEVVLTSQLAARLGVRPGAAAQLGDRRVTVVGILVPGSLAQINAVVAPAALVRDVAGRPAAVADVALVKLAPGVDAARWIDEHRSTLPGTDLEDVAGLRHPLATLFDSVNSILVSFSLLALFLAAYLVYLTFSTSVAERTTVYGTLLALGTSRRQLAGLVVAEALVLGLAGALVGVLLGTGLAVGISRGLTQVFHLPVPTTRISPLIAAGGVAVGLLAPAVGAMLPARRAARLSAVDAMRGEAGAPVQRRWLPIVGATAIFITAVTPPKKGSIALAVVIGFVLLLGAVQLLPPLIPWIARRLRPAARAIAPGHGEIGVLHLVRQRTRSGYTAGLMMAVLAVSLMLGAGYTSLHPAFIDYIKRQFGADVTVRQTSTSLTSEGPLGTGFEERVAHAQGVAQVTPVWYGSATLPEANRRALTVEVVDPETYFRVGSFHWTAGNDAVAAAALRQPGNVLLSLDVARRAHVSKGGHVVLETAGGAHRFHVAAIYSALGGSSNVVAGIGDGRRVFAAGRPSELYVRVAPGASPRAVRGAIFQALGGGPSLDIYLGSDAVAQALRQFNGVFATQMVVLVVVTLVGILALASTIAISVLDRRREIGVLRAVGIHRSEARRMVLIETAALVLVALFFGVVWGSLAASRSFSAGFAAAGFSAPFRYPWAWLPIVGAIALLATLLSAALPARRASSLDVVDALRLD